MFTDEHRSTYWELLRQRDLRQFSEILTPERLIKAAADAKVAAGRGALNLFTLTWLAIGGAWHTGHNFAGVLVLVFKLLGDAGRLPECEPGPRRGPECKRKSECKSGRGTKAERSKHDPRGTGAGVTEEAFTQARGRMPDSFWVALILILGAAFDQKHAPLTRSHDFRLVALDGTCIDLPRWKPLADHFGTASNGRTKKGTGKSGGHRTTQARMVMLQLPLVRMPLAYELTPLKQGERTVAGRLIKHVRPGDLILMDKGFWSYGLFHQIQNQKALFATRLVAGVKFKTVKSLGRGDRLVKWTPSDRQWKHLPESMTLRVISYQVRGFRRSAIVTNQTDPGQLSRDQWLGLASSDAAGPRLGEGLYHRRWGIETTFAELKVRQGMEGSIRGRTPEAVRFEVAGHVLLYLMTRWLMVEAAEEHGGDVLRLSFTNALREIKDMHQTMLTAGPERVESVLLPLLLERIAGHRVPDRPNRHYPRPHDTKVKNKGRGKRQLPSKLCA